MCGCQKALRSKVGNVILQGACHFAWELEPQRCQTAQIINCKCKMINDEFSEFYYVDSAINLQ